MVEDGRVGDALAHAKSVSGRSPRCAIMTTVDDCDLDAAKPTSHACLEGCANTICCERSVLCVKARDSTSSCHGLRLTQGDNTANILEDAVKLVFRPIRVCTTAGQSVTPADPKLLPEQPCDPGCASLSEVCCSCNVARVSTLPLSLHDLPDLSHAGASGLERKSDTFSVLLHTMLNGLSS